MDTETKQKKMPLWAWILLTGLLAALFLAIFAGPRLIRGSVTGWREVDGEMVYLREGKQVTGWLSDQGHRYYFDSSGHLLTGLAQVEGKVYDFDPDTGAVLTGWQEIDGSRYFFSADTGAREAGWVFDQGEQYYLAEDGVMVTGLKEIDGDTYFFDEESGALLSGWQDLPQGRAYFDPVSGSMVTGWLGLEGKRYYFEEDGTLAVGWTEVDGATYYFHEDGALAADEELTIEDEDYVFDASGAWHKAYTEAYLLAKEYIESHTDESMTAEEKFRRCYHLVASSDFKNPWIPHYMEMDWPQKYAVSWFQTYSGNCFSYAAALGYIAKVLGFESVYCCSWGQHGWCEIEGLIYDTGKGQYGTSYDKDVGYDFKGLIAPGEPWMHVEVTN